MGGGLIRSLRGLLLLSAVLAAVLATASSTSAEERQPVEALPLSESGDPFVDRLCWRFPGCPLSVIFVAPLIMVATVYKAGGRHPALLTLAGGGTFAGALVLLAPNPFTFFTVGAVAVASFILWKVTQ